MIDRHTAFNIAAVERVLSPGGTFITEQVDGSNLADLSEAFDSQQPWPFYTLDFMLENIGETHLELEAAHVWEGKMAFQDVGAIVYYLKAAPWTVPDFSVDRNLTHLMKLQERLEGKGELSFRQKLIFIRAKKI